MYVSENRSSDEPVEKQRTDHVVAQMIIVLRGVETFTDLSESD